SGDRRPGAAAAASLGMPAAIAKLDHVAQADFRAVHLVHEFLDEASAILLDDALRGGIAAIGRDRDAPQPDAARRLQDLTHGLGRIALAALPRHDGVADMAERMGRQRIRAL